MSKRLRKFKHDALILLCAAIVGSTAGCVSAAGLPSADQSLRAMRTVMVETAEANLQASRPLFAR